MSTKSVFFVEGRRAAAVKHSTFTSPDHTHVLLLFNTTRARTRCLHQTKSYETR